MQARFVAKPGLVTELLKQNENAIAGACRGYSVRRLCVFGSASTGAFERQFEVIGEALIQALRLDPSVEQHISDAKRITTCRNRPSHGYASV